jgi:hypothetical protein
LNFHNFFGILKEQIFTLKAKVMKWKEGKPCFPHDHDSSSNGKGKSKNSSFTSSSTLPLRNVSGGNSSHNLNKDNAPPPYFKSTSKNALAKTPAPTLAQYTTTATATTTTTAYNISTNGFMADNPPVNSTTYGKYELLSVSLHVHDVSPSF